MITKPRGEWKTCFTGTVFVPGDALSYLEGGSSQGRQIGSGWKMGTVPFAIRMSSVHTCKLIVIVCLE